MKPISPATLLILFICTALSSCMTFESQDIVYHHDDEKDEIRITLNYHGIFGHLSQNNPEDMATNDSLNQKQIEQLESVLEQKRAFFFSNWIFEYDPRALSEILTKDKPTTGGRVFGKPEKELVQNLLKNIEVINIGFYLGNEGKVCGAQTLRIKNLSSILTLANQVIQRQTIAHIPEWRERLASKAQNTLDENTLDEEAIQLLEKKMATPYMFIKIDGNLITLQFPSIYNNPEKKAQSISNELPHVADISIKDGDFIIKVGSPSGETGKLQKKCNDGYSPNAKNYLEEEYKSLFMSQNKVEKKLQSFLDSQN